MSRFDFNTLDFAYSIHVTSKNLRDFPRTYETKPYAVCLGLDTVSFEGLFSLTQEFFTDPLDPTDVELTMFEIEYSEYAKDKYIEIVNYYKGLGENNELGNQSVISGY
ncbi:MAG: hypothetical protein ACMV1B_12395 [Prevotella sp.]